MRFLAIMRDRRGFIHKRLIGAAAGFLGGGVGGAIGGFLGGGGGDGEKAVPGRLPAPRGGAFGGIGRARERARERQISRAEPAVRRFQGPLVPAFAPDPTDIGLPCFFPFVRQADGSCKFDLDPGQGTGLPGGNGGGFPAQDIGLASPNTVCVETMQCPTFADGKTGILWMNALTGQVFCLPRGSNGSGFGLIRKNKPRRKAFVTAAEISALRGQATTKKKAKKFAALTGQVCVTRGGRARSSHN